jgi:uncharacterized protein (DUF2147 family)
MKKLIVLGISFIMAFTSVLAQQANDIKGVWINENKDAKVEIYKSGDGYAGKIIWLKEMYEPDGKTLKKDSRNPDAKLRQRTILNLNILDGFTYDDGEWTGGNLYDPKSGKTYDSKMKLKGPSLEIRGYVGSPMFGKTTSWTRSS